MPNDPPLPVERAARPVAVRVFDADLRVSRDVAVPLNGPGSSCRVRLLSLPGARTTQVPVLENGVVTFRVEIPCDGDERLTLDLTWDLQHGLLADAPGRRALRLPADPRYAPPAPLYPHPSGALDLCIVVDGTARTVRNSGLEPLLIASAERDAYLEGLQTFIETLRAEFADLRLCLLAFGDHPPEEAEAADLKPGYVLFPDWRSARRLMPLTRDQIGAALRTIPSTPGGDFVDALGDALHICAELEWRPEARCLVVVSGDSPGFSMAHPSPPYADAHLRVHDVDTETERLHQERVEIMTIYHRAPHDASYEIDDPRPFVRFAQEQYKRLASHPGLHVELADFDPAGAARALLTPPRAIGRATALGVALDL